MLTYSCYNENAHILSNSIVLKSMSTINFKGKSFAENYHLSVPFHQLIPRSDKSLTDKVSLDDNLIIHGDNLKALKSLLSIYAGKIKCVYIDPPYNIGEENWLDNDDLKIPTAKEERGRVAGSQGEAFRRHAKWLCMMMPRLKLLRELLREDGVIFLSIDDHEQHRLQMLMDDIFGEDNFIASITVLSNSHTRNCGGVMRGHDYLLVYGRSEATEIKGLLDKDKIFPLKDGRGRFELRELRNRDIALNNQNRPNFFYPFYLNPRSKLDNSLYEISLDKKKGYLEVYPKQSQGVKTVWRWKQDRARRHLNTEIVGKKMRDGSYQIFEKHRQKTELAASVWSDEGVKARKGTLLLKEIFGRKVFNFPKPVGLIERIIEMSTTSGDIILDGFAGSGTSGHAVILQNFKAGGGNNLRRFILIEMEDYADSITAERIRRVIKGVPGAEDKQLQKGLSGSFSYFELGKPLEVESMLKGHNLPSYLDLARSVFYTATGQAFQASRMKESQYLIGSTSDSEVYMIYQPDMEYLKSAALTMDIARSLRKQAGDKKLIVFAPAKYIDNEELERLNIVFAQLPFEIYGIK